MPSEEEILRWLGEPVEAVIISADTFVLNKKNYPVLSKAHQRVVLEFLNMGASIVLRANTEDHASLINYLDYLKHLTSQIKPDPMNGLVLNFAR